MERESARRRRSVRVEVNMLRMFARTCSEKWGEGNKDAAYLWLKYLGWLFRMTADENEEEEERLLRLPRMLQLMVINQALAACRMTLLRRSAWHSLYRDCRRWSPAHYLEWCTDFTNRVVNPRDHYQVVVDTARRLNRKLPGGTEQRLELKLDLMRRALERADQVLRKNRKDEEEVVKNFRARLFVSPLYDLSDYWWFGGAKPIHSHESAPREEQVNALHARFKEGQLKTGESK